MPNESGETEVVGVEAETPIVTAEEGIESLRKQVEDERSRREAAEQRAQQSQRAAQEAQNRAVQAHTEAEDANLSLVTNALGAVATDISIAKANYAAAMASGDYDAAAEAQMAMSDLAVRRRSLEDGKKAMETRPKQAPQPAGTDPVEALAGQLSANGGYKSAEWVRTHPEFARDARQYQRMIAAHNLAVADGTIQVETDAYFAEVERILGLTKAASGAADPVAPPPRRSPPPAAPVGRPENPRAVRMSAEEVEMASMMGMTNEEWAKNRAALKAEGRLH